MKTLTAQAVRRMPRPAVAAVAALTLGLAGTAYAATTVVTSPPDLVTDTYAFVGGTINPDGVPTVYKFQYGETTDYGLETPVTNAGNGKAEVPVSTSFDDLKPNTTYHYRLVAYPDPAASPSYGVAVTAGQDVTFTTTPSLAVSVVGKKAKLAGERVPVTLAVVGPPDEFAAGKLTLKAKLGKKPRAIGVGRYRIRTGKSKTLNVRLARGAIAAIKDGAKLKATAVVKTKGLPAVTAPLAITG